MELETIIGLEIHCKLKTETKMFCRCRNEAFFSPANTNICPVCMGFPGQLPVLNEGAITLAIKAGLAFDCEINLDSKMDRKNYFYPDNPKGFQISQFDKPLSENGFLNIELKDNQEKRIRIKRIHIEDDAGKLTHLDNASLIDFNRAGSPLIEIVTEPDLSNSFEASFFAKEVQKIVRYIGVSDADMEKGMLRFDASISLRQKDETKLNHRAEIKNLNSFKALEQALDYEIERQRVIYEKGDKIEGDITLGFDEIKKITYFLRDKEEALDYRYFPEPDLPVLNLNFDDIEKLRSTVSILPNEKKKEYLKLGINIEEAIFVSSNIKYVNYFDKLLELTKDIKLCITFFNTILMKFVKEDMLDIDEILVSAENLSELILFIKEGRVSMNQAKLEVFPEMYKTGKNAKIIIEEKNLLQVSDEASITDICQNVIDENLENVESIKNGNERIFGFLVGQVIKKSQGRANPSIASKILRDLINS